MRQQEAKLKEVPCLYVENLSDAEKWAYVLADNKLALNATWDEDFQLMSSKPCLTWTDFDLSLLGFDIAMDSLIEGLALEEDGDPDDDVLPEDIGLLPARGYLATRLPPSDLRG